MTDRLTALEQRGDELEVFANCERQAREWIARNGTQSVVDELRAARDGRRRIRLGTPNALLLLAHIDALQRFVEFVAMLPATTGGAEKVRTEHLASRARETLASLRAAPSGLSGTGETP